MITAFRDSANLPDIRARMKYPPSNPGYQVVKPSIQKITTMLVLALALAASGCNNNDYATAVANNFKAMYLCQDHGGFREIPENQGNSFTVICKDGLVIYGTQ